MEENKDLSFVDRRQGEEDRRQNGNERRKFPRIYKKFTTRIQLASGDDKKWDVIFLDNLSAGGVFFRHNQKLEPGTLLNLMITFPASSQPTSCVAKVLRVQQVQNLSIYEIAAEFLQIDESTVKIINEFAEKIFPPKKNL